MIVLFRANEEADKAVKPSKEKTARNILSLDTEGKQCLVESSDKRRDALVEQTR